MGVGIAVGCPGAAKMDAAVSVVVGTGREGVDSVNEDRVQVIDRSAGLFHMIVWVLNDNIAICVCIK